MRNPELEAIITAAPDDLDGYEVYADWLIEQGEPHGELILFEVRRRRSGVTPDFEVLAAEARLLQDRARMFGAFGALPKGAGVSSELDLGFLRSVSVWEGEGASQALRLALTHRAGAFLRHLEVLTHERRSFGSSLRNISTDRATARVVWDVLLEVGLPKTLESVGVLLLNDAIEAQCQALVHVPHCTFPLRCAGVLAPHVGALRALRSLTFTSSKRLTTVEIEAIVELAPRFAAIERIVLAVPPFSGLDLAPLRAALPQLVLL